MERWINSLPPACGVCAGLLAGTGHSPQGLLVALLGIAALCGLRLLDKPAHDA
jgi:hypothetical protein